jgi:hypothetical protein
MSDERSTFEAAKARLDDVALRACRKDVSLEEGIELLEEAVRLVNECNELVDQTSFASRVPEDEAADDGTSGSVLATDVVVETTVVVEDDDARE